MKTCTKCKETKDIDDFPNDSSKKDGKRPQCRACVAIARKEYDKRTVEKRKTYQKEYRKKNQDKLSKYHKQYLENGGREVRKNYRDENRDKIRQLKRHNNALRKALIKKSGLTAEDYQIWISNELKYCAYCGVDCSDNFHIDHVEPLVTGGQHVIDNFALTCPHCNTSKGSKSLISFLATESLHREYKPTEVKDNNP